MPRMNMVMVPYCTGDVHSGNKTLISGDAPRYYYLNFFGNINFQRTLGFLKKNFFANTTPGFTNVKTIWLMGTSAGAGGASVQYSYLRTQFFKANPNAIDVHLIEDSAPVIVPPQGDPNGNDITAWQAYCPVATPRR